jgi:membrane protein implicated in regulation of membrane protease activity
MWWIWLILAIVLLLIEYLLPDPVTVWSGLAAAVVCLFALIPPIPWYVEIILFIVISIGLMIAFPPKKAKKLLRRLKLQAKQETALDYLLKNVAVVKETVDNDLSTGVVKVNGVLWTARSVDNTVIEKESIVSIESIDGNKLYVKLKEEGVTEEEQEES